MRSGLKSLLGCLISGALLAPLASFSQTLTVNTSLCGCQPGAGNPCPGNINYLVGTFAFNITSGCPSFTAVNSFTTSGTYVAADILNIKLYETNFSVFNTSTLVATIGAGLGPGTHSFTGFNRTTCAAAQRYYWITVDFAAGAVAGHTFRVDLITAAMYAITGTVNYGTNTTAGVQTICNPLPVELISFTGKRDDGKNVLEWRTASEMNNDYFTVERSEDGISFVPVVVLRGAGTTSQVNSYTVVDQTESVAPVTYYRLRQTDFNGQFEYPGGIIAIQSEAPDDAIAVGVSGTALTVQQHEGELNYTIYDLAGRECQGGTVGEGKTEINIAALPQGTYILRFNDRAQTSKLFVKGSN